NLFWTSGRGNQRAVNLVPTDKMSVLFRSLLFIMPLSTFFYGSRVRLTPLIPNDVPTLARWQSDTEYLRLLAAEPAFPKNEGQVAEWVREGQRGRDNFLLGIRTLTDDDLI